MSSEFADLVAVIDGCVNRREPLPLATTLALSNGRLEAMWAKSRDPAPMVTLLHDFWVELPVVLALVVAARAGTKIPSTNPDDSHVAALLRELDQCFHRVGGAMTIEAIKRAVDYHMADPRVQRAPTAVPRMAWEAIAKAVKAVKAAMDANGSQFNELDVQDYVLNVFEYAVIAGGAKPWLADRLRPFGPPSLERIVESLHRV